MRASEGWWMKICFCETMSKKKGKKEKKRLVCGS
jgi:hypothetical protein